MLIKSTLFVLSSIFYILRDHCVLQIHEDVFLFSDISSINLFNSEFVVWEGKTQLMVLKIYSWVSAQVSLLMVLRGSYMWCQVVWLRSATCMTKALLALLTLWLQEVCFNFSSNDCDPSWNYVPGMKYY